jgi:hypothetical protein
MFELKKLFNDTFNNAPVTSLLFYQSCRDGDLEAVKDIIFQLDLDNVNIQVEFNTPFTGVMTLGRVSNALDEVIYNKRVAVLKYLVLESGM